MAKRKTLTVQQAVSAMLKSEGGKLAIRPTHLRDTGVGYITHNKQLYRYPLAEDKPAFSCPVTDMMGRWETVTTERLDFEIADPAAVEQEALAKRKGRKGRKSRKQRDPNAPPRAKNVGGRRGRPSAAEITAAHPGWTNICAAANEIGVAIAVVREAVKNGQVPVIYDRGCTLLQLEVLRECAAVKAAHGRTRGRPRKAAEPVVESTEAAPASSSEVYS